MSDDVDLMVRDFRTEPTEPRRRDVRYLSNMPAADELPVRVVHPIARLRQMSTQSTDAIDAWARHAVAANGFGDGAIEGDASAVSDNAVAKPARRRAVRKHLSLAAHRVRAMADAVAAMVWVSYWLIGRFIRSWVPAAEPAPTYRAARKPRVSPTLRQSRVS